MFLINHSVSHIKRIVAEVLLNKINNVSVDANRFSIRDIASLLDTDRETVRLSLQTLQTEGAIRIDRSRVLINKGLLQKIVDAI